MTILSYGFGMALGIAFAVTIGGQWAREHRQGVWSRKMAVTATVAAILIGLLIGWSLQQYLAFVAESATRRY